MQSRGGWLQMIVDKSFKKLFRVSIISMQWRRLNKQKLRKQNGLSSLCWNLNLNNYPMLQWNIQGKHAGTTLFGSVNVKSLQFPCAKCLRNHLLLLQCAQMKSHHPAQHKWPTDFCSCHTYMHLCIAYHNNGTTSDKKHIHSGKSTWPKVANHLVLVFVLTTR